MKKGGRPISGHAEFFVRGLIQRQGSGAQSVHVHDVVGGVRADDDARCAGFFRIGIIRAGFRLGQGGTWFGRWTLAPVVGAVVYGRIAAFLNDGLAGRQQRHGRDCQDSMDVHGRSL